jgi:hypothetical protein
MPSPPITPQTRSTPPPTTLDDESRLERAGAVLIRRGLLRRRPAEMMLRARRRSISLTLTNSCRTWPGVQFTAALTVVVTDSEAASRPGGIVGNTGTRAGITVSDTTALSDAEPLVELGEGALMRSDRARRRAHRGQVRSLAQERRADVDHKGPYCAPRAHGVPFSPAGAQPVPVRRWRCGIPRQHLLIHRHVAQS